MTVVSIWLPGLSVGLGLREGRDMRQGSGIGGGGLQDASAAALLATAIAPGRPVGGGGQRVGLGPFLYLVDLTLERRRLRWSQSVWVACGWHVGGVWAACVWCVGEP